MKLVKCILIVTLIALWPITGGFASFSLKNAIKSKFNKKEKEVLEGIDLRWIDLKNNTQKTIRNQWNLNLNAELIDIMWLGSTFKDVPYTEREFINIRNQKIAVEMEKLKEDHINKEKEKLNKVEEEEEELLDDFLNDDDGEEDSEKDKETNRKKKAEENKKYLANFDERKMRRQIMLKLFISQSRPVLTQALFVQTKNLEIYCIDIRTGLTVWVSRILGAVESPPYESDKQIFILAEGKAFVLDKRSGFVSYHSKIDRAVYPLIFGKGTEAYAVSYKNKIFKWDLEDHYEKWNERLWDECSEGVVGDDEGLLVSLRTGILKFYDLEGQFKWEFVNETILNDKIYYEKLRNDYIQLIAKEKSEAREEDRRPDIGKLRKYGEGAKKAEGKLLRLAHATRGQYEVRPIIHTGEIFIPSTDYNLYSLNRYSGTVNWSFNCGSKLKTVPSVNSKVVWQKDIKGNLFCIDRKEGKQIMKINGVQKVHGSSNEMVYYRDAGGRLIVESPERKSQLTLSDKYTPVINADLKIILCLDKKTGAIHQYRLVGK